MPEQVFRSFPLQRGEEWYPGPDHRVYLCLQSRLLNDKQVAWLTSSKEIANWEDMFDLTPISVRY